MFENKRDFLKTKFSWHMDRDQKKGIEPPAIVKPYDENDFIVSLPKPNDNILKIRDYDDIVTNRNTYREYEDEIIRLDELSYLLWASQGVRHISQNGMATFRNVPSGGARHAFETYIAVDRVEGLQKGVYRYLPIEHALLLVRKEDDYKDRIISASLDQKFVGKAPMQLIYTCIPYREEWRYSDESYKLMMIDLGIITESVYLTSTALSFGTCAIGAYVQKLMDEFVEVDGEEEFVVFTMPVGRV